MRAVWIYPLSERCGISFYSRKYVDALKKHATVDVLDIGECLKSIDKHLDMLNACDVVHLQYETSFFLGHRRDCFKSLRAKLARPCVVSLHEVHDQFPGVFPRNRITGKGLVRTLKEAVYDLRHPYQTLYRAHVHEGFYADKLLVHWNYQRRILEQRGLHPERIRVIPHPVGVSAHADSTRKPPGNVINLASVGFINPNYDYDLLFNVLSGLPGNWQFTWIGGPRKPEHKRLLADLRDRIAEKQWTERFRITGWVSDGERDALLSEAGIVLALFSARSSSESLATALAARKLIVATELPLVLELAASSPAVTVVERDVPCIVNAIQRLREDAGYRDSQLAAVDTYVAENNFAAMATRVAALYQEVV